MKDPGDIREEFTLCLFTKHIYLEKEGYLSGSNQGQRQHEPKPEI